ncbi:TerB family tellurite resistance protein [Candidatus Kapabacteria bacterium]|nr:TerB family tellurite resistance protein [Candidatus Kapabacteria bacterium]
MSARSQFTEEEWNILESAPFLVFSAVADADGEIDNKELKAFKKVLKNYDEFSNPLTTEVLESFSAKYDENATISKPEMEEKLKQVPIILEAKVGYKDALSFKKALIAIGIHVGNSSGGIFSSKFSDEEVEALKRVGLLLGVSEAQLQQAPSIKELINAIKR